MARASVVASSVGAALVVLAGGYAVADAYDVVPGRITNDAPLGQPQSFPTFATPSVHDLTAPIASLDSEAPLPSSTEIQRLADQLNRDSRIGGGSAVGLSVVDIETGQVLAGVRSDVAQIPASNMKILTAVAAEYTLPLDERFVTSVTWSGEPQGDLARLTLVAGGDMLLASEYGHKGARTSPSDYAGVADLADAVVSGLEQNGVARVDIVVDDSAFGGASIPSSWDWDFVDDGYGAPTTGLAINTGCVQIAQDKYRCSRDPSIGVGDTLAKALETRGVEVHDVSRGKAGANDITLAFIESAPIRDVLSHTLDVSQNTLAELFLKLIASEAGRSATTAEGIDQTRRVLSGLGLDCGGVVITDGSGLARADRIPPRALTDLIVLLAHDPDHDSLLEQLPIAALRGTLWDRFHSTEGAGVVRGKTGSLSGVTALSGTVVTADGRWLAYSILADGLPWGQTKPRAAMDEFLSSVAACGC